MTLADSIFSVGWDLKISYDSILAGGEKFAYSVNGTCFDTGKTTAAVLRRFERYTDARTSGDPSERSSGNGSIIRLTPVPIRYRDLFRVDLRRLSSLAVETSPDYSRSSSRGGVSRGRCEEKDDMAAQHIGEYVSKDMAFFDEAGARLTAPQQIARE